MWQRIAFTILLILGIVFLPFWIYFFIGIIGIFYFDFYLEAFIAFLISDFIFGVEINKLFNIHFFQSLAIFLILLLAEFIKKNSKFYKKEND